MCRVEFNADLGKPLQNCCETMSKIKLYRIAKGGFRLCIIILNHVYYISYLTWMVLLYPLTKIGLKHLYYKIEGQMQYGMLKMIAMWRQSAGYEVWEAGDDITDCLEERTLVLVNHQCSGDVITLFNAFINRSEILPNVMWIMENLLKYTHFGLVSSIHRDFFIFQGKEFREKSLEALAEHVRDVYLPMDRKWMVLFPEGGFLHKRRESSQRYGEKNNLPHLEHVTIPRMGAFHTVMRELNDESNRVNNNNSKKSGVLGESNLKYILDVTIGYPNGKPIDIADVAFGSQPPNRTTIFYRLFPITDIELMKDESKQSQWLIDRWVEKEGLLDTFYKTGEFPLGENSKQPTIVRQNLLNYAALHLAFACSSFLQYKFFALLFQYLHNCIVSY